MIDTKFLKRFVDAQGTINSDILDVDDNLTNICWLPILDTIIEPENWPLFWTLWDEQKTFMSHQGRDSALWESLCIWKAPHLSKSEIIHNLFPQRVVDWSQHFPKMFEKIFTVMPFSEIWKVTLGENIRIVPAHVDRPTHPQYDVLYPWPNSIRVVLHDTNLRPTFFLTPWPEKLLINGKIQDNSAFEEWGTIKVVPENQKCYVDLPARTNTFAFSNGEFLHGADFESKSKILLLIWGKPAAPSWKQKLLSITEKFPQYKNLCKLNDSKRT